MKACGHPFFDELRLTTCKMPNDSPLSPELFEFTTEELSLSPGMENVLIPKHLQSNTPNNSK